METNATPGREMSVDLLIRNVRRRADVEAVDIAIDSGRITEVGPALEIEAAQVLDGDGSLVLPGLVNAHQHLDKTLIGDELRPSTWDGTKLVLRTVNRQHRRGYTVESIVDRASKVVEMAIINGTTYLRGFADVEQTAGTTGVRALAELRSRFSDEIDIDGAAFPQDLIYGRDDNSRLMEEAVASGATVVGGMPSEEPTLELVQRHVDFCLDLAKRNDLPVHVLIDDTDDPSHRGLEYLAWRTIKEGMEGRVIAGHCGALSSYDHAHAAMVIDRVKEAGISVCANAHISLTLQGRQDRAPVRRGTTRVKELLDAGVNVLAAQDDVDDPYYPLGRADLLEVAHYTAHVCHLLWPQQLELVADMITTNAAQAVGLDNYGLMPGNDANLTLLGRPTLRQALADMPPRRAVVSKGRLVAESVVTQTRHTLPARELR
jgi:cytosine/creatinine deaminase